MVSVRVVRCFRSAISRQKGEQREWLNARCAREVLVGQGVRPILYRVCVVMRGMVFVAARYVKRRTERGVVMVKHR
jgi:hypothetical protein